MTTTTFQDLSTELIIWQVVMLFGFMVSVYLLIKLYQRSRQKK